MVRALVRFPTLMARLVACPPLERLAIRHHCREWAGDSGVYVFYEDDNPKYVGRSDGLIERIQLHGRNGSRPNEAAFAAWLTREVFFRKTYREHKNTPIRDLWRIPQFAGLEIKGIMDNKNFPGEEHFAAAKRRIRGMSIRVVEISDPNAQAMFEVYAHLVLNTPYNTFVNH